MPKIAIVSDTSCDMSIEMAEEQDIHLVDTYVNFGTETYTVSDMTMKEFHERLEKSGKKHFPKTSQPKAKDFLQIYKKLQADGYDTIISIHVAADLSGTINSANVAKGMIDDIDIHIVDSKGVSALLTAVVLRARKLVDDGMIVEKILEQLQNFANNLSAYVVLETLDNLVKGGRMSRVKYWFGWLLNIKPILVLGDGKIEPYAKARGIDNAREKMYDISTDGWNSTDKFNFIVAHTQSTELAQELKHKVESNYPNAEGFILEIGIVVGTHAGRGALLLLTFDSI